MHNGQLTILGGGNIGRALIGGLLRQGMRPEQITVGEPQGAAREALGRDFGVQAVEDNAAAASAADLIVLAVKPQYAGGVLQGLRAMLVRNRPIVISVVAGLRSQALEHWCGPGVPVVRAMPNRPALVGAGATGLYASREVSAAARQSAERILRSTGEVVWVDTEDQLDAVTALSGSGPAYFFLLAEAMTSAATGLGLPAAVARRLAVATLHGAGELARSSDGELARLRAEVTSKGGTTEAALRHLTPAFDELMARALAAAARRSRELAEQFADTRAQGT
jgi:pyrroline-5-carboxylate reductase